MLTSHYRLTLIKKIDELVSKCLTTGDKAKFLYVVTSELNKVNLDSIGKMSKFEEFSEFSHLIALEYLDLANLLLGLATDFDEMGITRDDMDCLARIMSKMRDYNGQKRN